MELFVFNPENDLALANNQWHFIAPASARKMRLDLETLPVWWTGRGDRVWVSRHPQHAPFVTLGLDDRFVVGLEQETSCHPAPWGWSPLMRSQFLRGGMDEALLPDEAWMAVYRQHAGRGFAVSVLERLRASAAAHAEWSGSLCGRSFYCTDTDQIDALFRQYPRTILKAPWSGSGKGLRLGQPELRPPLTGWCARQIREQGGVVVEPLYNKVCDFACEFTVDRQGQVAYEGLSVFATTHQGAYAGNWLASEADKERFLRKWLPEGLLEWVRAGLTEIFREALGGFYCGPLGVDMMVCASEDGTFRLHPCVEINLRMTMGMVALRLQSWLVDGVQGRFYIDFAADSGELDRRAQEDAAQRPPRFRDGKLAEGCLPLTPVSAGTCYRACLEAGEVFPG